MVQSKRARGGIGAAAFVVVAGVAALVGASRAGAVGPDPGPFVPQQPAAALARAGILLSAAKNLTEPVSWSDAQSRVQACYPNAGVAGRDYSGGVAHVVLANMRVPGARGLPVAYQSDVYAFNIPAYGAAQGGSGGRNPNWAIAFVSASSGGCVGAFTGWFPGTR